ncbi:MAG TPA: FlgD immunoglobulin-like domain containing protein, partial [Candidatus Limnocylindrales bacterium]|nr:FlgD immunoglobulin-like domain containing protein [Candidatus Limnocylindrales bacterium]
MRRPVAIAVLAFVGTFAALGNPPATNAATARTPAKVVIVVGATHGTTPTYRKYADAAYAEAIKYTPNVVKVYSPNATWSRVKAAAVGASILIYFGHGNGWPSPYTYDPQYTTKDGMGLNADLNGDGKLSDYENKYYGEPYMKSLDLAPNAIVLLHNLCYASGNSEPGKPQPTVSVARQRISNYAAGFLASNAQAVIADGHHGPADYIRALFTTDQTIEQLWRTAPDNNGHVSSFTSTRTSGVRALMDPEGTSSGFYRSLVTHPTLTTRMVVGTVDTSRDPATLQVPGRASARVADALLWPDLDAAVTGTPETAAPQAIDSRFATISRPTQTGPAGVALIEVARLDDATVHGFMRAADLTPRDSLPPRVLAVDPAAPVLSPNGDGVADTTTISAALSESAAWRIRFRDADGATLYEATGDGADPEATWDGLADGTPVPDGTYSYRIDTTDGWSNASYKTGTVRVDLTGPTLTGVTPAADMETWIAPNGDGVRESVAFAGSMSEGGSLAAYVRDAGGTLVRSFSVPTGTAAVLTWDGKANDGSVVPDGTYEVRLIPRDAVGNAGASVTRSLTVAAFLGSVTSSKAVFYPQDRDTLSTGTRLSFALKRPATVTWTIRNAAGTVVATLLDGVETPAGTTALSWYALNDAGAMLPTGRYTAVVSATDGALTAVQAVGFEMNAFGIRPSASTATRGRSISIS